MKGHSVLTSSDSDEYGTPHWLFQQLNNIYRFTLDPCASEDNFKCYDYYTKEQDGLVQPWAGHRVFVNPPYSDIKRWMLKCRQEWELHNILVVALVPNRSDTQWYHQSVHTFAQVTIIKGRLTFDGLDKTGQKITNGATFPSILVTYMPRFIRP